MKMTKRILAVILALVLALSVFALSASAVNWIDGSMTYSVQADSDSYGTGDTVTVNIYLNNDYNATCIRFPVLFSADVFELPNNIRLTAYGDCNTYKGSLEANTSNDGSYTPVEYDTSEYGAILVQWTASVNATRIGCFQSAEPVKCFSFQLKVKSTAGGLAGSIFIPEESDLFYNQAVTTVTDATTICYVNVENTFSPLNVTIGQGDSEGITTVPGSSVVIDYINKVIKNWAPPLDKNTIMANVMPVGSSTLSYESSEGEGAGYGTGALVRVWSGTGSALGDYSIILLGDINGDGVINASDSNLASRRANNYITIEEGSPFYTACDADCSGDINASDYNLISRHANNYGEIDQSAF